MLFLMAAPLVVSIFRPIVYYGQRYLIVATLPFYLLVGLGLKRLARARPHAFASPAASPVAAPLAPLRRAAAALALSLALGVIIRWHVDYFDSRQKRPFDVAAARLDASFRPGDIIVANPDTTAACLRRYLREPFRIVVDAPEAAAALDAVPPGARVWFVTLAMTASPTEKKIADASPHERTDVHEVLDIPGLILRATPYVRPLRESPPADPPPPAQK